MLKSAFITLMLAAGAAHAGDGRWVEAFDDGRYAFYADEQGMKSQGDTHQAWVHVEFAERDAKTGDYGMASYNRYDCAEGTVQSLRLASYDQPDREHVRLTSEGDGEVNIPLPDSRQEELLKFVCDLAAGKPWTKYRERRDTTPPPNGNVE